MSAVFERRTRRVVRSAVALLAVLAATAASAETFTVNVDQAHILKVPDKVTTIVIGNPLIADASLQSGGMLVVTGKSFGSTNLLALDRNGKTVMDTTLQVQGPAGSNLVVVYRGSDRESYSCTPECQPRVTLGDEQKFFSETLAQSGARSTQAQTPAH
jgi:hypothetical protein